MYRIGMFSKITKTTIKTLRYYNKVGLLVPAFTDSNGYRYYTSDQLTTFHKILSLKQLGFSIKEISSIINDHNVDEIIREHEEKLLSKKRTIEDQLSRIKNYINEEDIDMNYQVVIKELPECIVYSKRTVIPSYDYYFELIPQIGEKVRNRYPDLKCRVPEYCFVIYRDGEYKDKDIDIEYCEAVTEMREDFEDIKFKKMPSVTAAVVLHKGPYSTLGNAYSYLFKWIEDNEYKIIDSPRESYIDGIWNKDSEEDWLTEIQVPVMKK
jgi:DNA-binding transcriptional MerR regulator